MKVIGFSAESGVGVDDVKVFRPEIDAGWVELEALC